jgi:SWI/SNF-related matrix-associated actin-dependent regulator of chromatin subfamily A3
MTPVQLANIPVSLKQTSCGLEPHSKNLPVVFKDPNTLVSLINNSTTSIKIPCPISAKLLNEIEAVAEIFTQLYCHDDLGRTPVGVARQKCRRRGNNVRPWSLNIILYGPIAFGDAIGKFLTARRIYLQDPLGCDRRVLYRNPHIIQPENRSEVMTDGIDSSLGNLEIERLDVGPDLLAQLMENEVPLPETDAPAIITTPLFRYVTHDGQEPIY